MVPYRLPAERPCENPREELYKQILRNVLPLVHPGRLSEIFSTYTINDIVSDKKWGGDPHWLCRDVCELLGDPADNFLPPDVKTSLQRARQEIQKMAFLERFATHDLGYLANGQRRYFAIGPLLRHIEDYYYAYDHYLKTGRRPTLQEMEWEKRFQRRKMLVELIIEFIQYIPEEAVKADAAFDSFLVEATAGTSFVTEKKITFRNEKIHFIGFLIMVESAIRDIEKSDGMFFSSNALEKIQRAKELMKARKAMDPPLYYGSAGWTLWDSLSHVKREGPVYTTGFMPIVDWYFASKARLHEEYVGRTSTFETSTEETDARVGTLRKVFKKLTGFAP